MTHPIKLTESEFRNLIKKYWQMGMNNVYWNNIQDKIQDDVNKYSFRRDLRK